MQFEYILLLSVFFFPFWYKFLYWGKIFENCEYNWGRLREFMRTPQGTDSLLHFWIFLELPLLLLSFGIFINPPFEVFLYNIYFYFLLLYNIFVFGKILRGKIQKVKITALLFLTFIIISIDSAWAFYMWNKYIYTLISGILIAMPVYFIATIWLKNIYTNIMSWKK